jgi:esterase/lipase
LAASRRRWALGPVLALVLLALLGPRVEIDETLHPVVLPGDLDAYLAESERAFPDITPEAEKTIVWAGEPGERTDTAVLYFHGFSATRQETSPLPEDVAAALGANLFLTRLTGHGRPGSAMAEASVNAWLNDAEEALAIGRRLGERIVLIGTSQGGTLATWAAGQPRWQEVLEALVLISPNYGPKAAGSGMLTWPWGAQLARLVIGENRTWEPVNELQATYWTVSYPSSALLPMMGLVKLVWNEVDPATITAPAFLIYSLDDVIVDANRAVERFGAFSSERKEMFEILGSADPDDHVLVGDILSPESTGPAVERIVSFVRGG